MTVLTTSPDGVDASLPILEVRDLSVSYGAGRTANRAVYGISFKINRGETLAIVGESGSGKTTTAQSIIGLLSGGRIDGGQVLLNGTDIAGWSDRRLDGLRGSRIGLIPQDPGSSLNPIRTIGSQLVEMFQIHGHRLSKAAGKAKVLELLAKVGLSSPELRYDQYPHQLSGGMRQRVLIAMAIMLEPELIIADEPTSALDVTVQKRILDLIETLKRETNASILLITHDLGVAARADAIVVMHQGHIVESGPTAEIIASPKDAYTQRLLSDAPSFADNNRVRNLDGTSTLADDVVVVESLSKRFSLPGKSDGLLAVDDLSFRVARGTTHAIVGESGSGKTTTIRMVTGFEKPTTGRIVIGGESLAELSGEKLRQFRRKIQLVYQNPFSSLDPRQTISQIVDEPLRNFEPLSPDERAKRVQNMISRVGLPADVLDRHPATLSGGQRQRVAIARALILQPEVVVLDEAVSALDVTVQARILALLSELQREFGLTYIFVSHDLAVVRQIADTVSVMRNGQDVEHGPVETVFGNPQHAYTQELVASIPTLRQSA
ncbi:ABC transporter ATP-binding protein [Agrobacterium sp.]|jgi:peptide/nickel transport system ATP-binding protein|uniref:ABC transporter ATP-binding protein n=1 Tax=Agrobacterium sp. TaxID=361 RepID=UPI0028A9C7C7